MNTSNVQRTVYWAERAGGQVYLPPDLRPAARMLSIVRWGGFASGMVLTTVVATLVLAFRDTALPVEIANAPFESGVVSSVPIVGEPTVELGSSETETVTAEALPSPTAPPSALSPPASASMPVPTPLVPSPAITHEELHRTPVVTVSTIEPGTGELKAPTRASHAMKLSAAMTDLHGTPSAAAAPSQALPKVVESVKPTEPVKAADISQQIPPLPPVKFAVNRPTEMAVASKFAIKSISSTGVVLANGAKIPLGGHFPNQEQVIGIDVAEGRIDTDRRVIILLPE
jgi:hypothetical protein